MKNKPEIEKTYNIWPNDGDGWYVNVGPDSDGLGCVEIRYHDEKDKITERMAYSPEIALLVGQALVQSANDILNKKSV